MMLALPYIDEVMECPVCIGWGNFSTPGSYSGYFPSLVNPCTYCGGARSVFRGEHRMREFQQLAQYG